MKKNIITVGNNTEIEKDSTIDPVTDVGRAAVRIGAGATYKKLCEKIGQMLEAKITLRNKATGEVVGEIDDTETQRWACEVLERMTERQKVTTVNFFGNGANFLDSKGANARR